MSLSEPTAKKTLGVGGRQTHLGDFRADEWQRELKGRKAIKKYREMRDSDATIGAVMYATEQVLRDVKYKITPADDSEQAQEMANFVSEVLEDMDHTLDDHISEAVSCLSYGFADFEVVYKRRGGSGTTNPKKFSRYSDGRIGIRKIASRAQWTINKFDVDQKTGDLLGIYQEGARFGDRIYIPADKLLHYKTTTTNNDPSGRSILRNAYKSYTYLTKLQAFEAIAIEREWHGMPVGRIPAEYLIEGATDEQKAFKQSVETMLKDVKRNEEGFLLLPSDVYTDSDGKMTNQRLVEVELISSQGNRSIDIRRAINDYQHEIASSVLAEFIKLGSRSGGSYALSKSKADIFLRTLESYLNTIFDVLNKQLLPQLWKLNGFDFSLMPKVVAGDIAPHDLKELGAYLRNLNGAGIPVKEQVHIIDELLNIAELPELDRDVYASSLEQIRETETARNDYYDDDDEPRNKKNTEDTPEEEED